LFTIFAVTATLAGATRLANLTVASAIAANATFVVAFTSFTVIIFTQKIWVAEFKRFLHLFGILIVPRVVEIT
jgi:hypothetical protein